MKTEKWSDISTERVIMTHSTRPNILIFLCDQLRRQAMSVYGDPNIDTLHIDALARRGVRFAHACSTYPICVPFRFTMMTGEYAHTRKVPGMVSAIFQLFAPAVPRLRRSARATVAAISSGMA